MIGSTVPLVVAAGSFEFVEEAIEKAGVELESGFIASSWTIFLPIGVKVETSFILDDIVDIVVSVLR